jgi:hypothetical protein
VNQSGKVVYGLDAEVAVKNELKRDPLEEKVILDWIKVLVMPSAWFSEKSILKFIRMLLAKMNTSNILMKSFLVFIIIIFNIINFF